MLINCVAYQDGKKLGAVPVPEISDYVKRRGGFVWVAIKDATENELAEMQKEFELHELAVEDSHHGHQRAKVDEYGDSLFAVIKLVDWGDEELSIGELNVFVGEKYLLSLRNNSAQTFTSVRQQCESEPHFLKKGPGYVFYALLDSVVDRYFPIIAKFEDDLDRIEEQIFVKGAARTNIERLYELKRKVMVFKQAVEPLMQAVGRLHGGRVPRILSTMQDYFRDIDDHLVRINAATDRIHDTIGTAIQVTLSMVTIEHSEINKHLAAWAGIFGIATAFAGIWGMNFEHMPELQWAFGYPVSLAAIAGACGLLYYRFKRMGWL